MVTRFLACLILLGLPGCSQKIMMTTTVEAQTRAALETPTPPVEPKPESPVKVVGDFTNVKSNGEHQWGYSVELWRQGDKIYGLISGSDSSRLIGDPPTGLLENVQFDPKTGRLSFRAKLTLGLFFGVEPSRDVYQFEGVLTKKKLLGSLLATNELCPDKCPEKKKISLPRSKESSSEMEEFHTYQSFAEWKAFADRILKFRGPEW